MTGTKLRSLLPFPVPPGATVCFTASRHQKFSNQILKELMRRTFKRCGQKVLFRYVEFMADIRPIFHILAGPPPLRPCEVSPLDSGFVVGDHKRLSEIVANHKRVNNFTLHSCSTTAAVGMKINVIMTKVLKVLDNKI